MGEFTKDPGGHKVADPGDGVGYTNPGVGWHNDPGGGGWKSNQNPGTGWKLITDPGTGV